KRVAGGARLPRRLRNGDGDVAEEDGLTGWRRKRAGSLACREGKHVGKVVAAGEIAIKSLHGDVGHKSEGNRVAAVFHIDRQCTACYLPQPCFGKVALRARIVFQTQQNGQRPVSILWRGPSRLQATHLAGVQAAPRAHLSDTECADGTGPAG